MKRLWLDANVVLRTLTGDPPHLAASCARLMAEAEAGRLQLYVAPLVLAEVVWVLKSFYRHPLGTIRDTLFAFLTHTQVVMDDRDLALESLDLAALRNVDFIDAYLALSAQRAGAEICTLDSTDFAKLPAKWRRPDEV